MKDRNAREVREGRGDQVIIVAGARNARIRIETREDRIEVLVRSRTESAIDRIVASVLEPVEARIGPHEPVGAVIGLRRTQVARLLAAGIDDELFENDSGVDAPEPQHMLSWPLQPVPRRRDPNIVGDGLLPRAIRAVGDDVHDLRRVVVERDRVA